MKEKQPVVFNIPRCAAIEWSTEVRNACWISIGEPEKGFCHVQNKILNELPNLKISFQDLDHNQIEIGDCPPNRKHMKKIMSFLRKNKGKHLIVNCAAGVSRSSAIAKFLEDFVGYRWAEYGKSFALPNKLVYDILVQLHKERPL